MSSAERERNGDVGRGLPKFCWRGQSGDNADGVWSTG